MKLNDIYKCEVCGNVVELTFVGGGELVCCGKPMIQQAPKSEDQGTEKHKPVINDEDVEVGSVPHPMEEEHFITWIESVDGEDVYRVNLKPGDDPKAKFGSAVKEARAYCNVHGLWKS